MALPEVGYVRIWQIIGCRKRKVEPIIPVCAATWWSGVKSGRYPSGVRDGHTRMWSVESIRALLADMAVSA